MRPCLKPVPAIIGLAAALVARPAIAQVLFDTPYEPCADVPGAVAAGDIDGDGDADLVVASPTGNIVTVRTNGEGILRPGQISDVGVEPRDLLLHDLDGDDRLDAIVANAGSGGITILFGRGDGTFDPAIDHSTGQGAAALTIGDVDGDLDPDVIVVNEIAQTISVLRNAGSRAFDDAESVFVGNDPSGVAIGDLDGDAMPDLAVTRTAPVDGNWGDVLVMLNRGDGVFEPDRSYVTGLSSRSPAIGDLDGDTRNDIALVNANGLELAILFNRGLADFGDGTVGDNLYWEVGIFPHDLQLHDLDGDDDLDVVVANIHTTVVLLNQGGAFSGRAYAIDVEPEAEPLSIAVGELGGDDAPDIFVSHDAGSYGYIGMLVNHGDATFDSAVAYSVSDGQGLGDGPLDVAFGDMNGDGDVDMFTVNPESNDITLVSNAGDGTFGPIVVGGTPPQVRPSYDVGTRPASLATGDLDGLGGIDVVTANQFGASVTVLRNTNFASFGARDDYDAGLLPDSVVLADLDGDDDLDIVVGYLFGSAVSILPNNGDTTFAPHIDIPAGFQPRTVAIADLDGDNDPDLAVGNEGDASITILLNQGAMSFTNAGTFPVEAPRAIVAGDWDENGIVDLAISSTDGGRIWTIPGLGNATFGTPVPYETRVGAAKMSAGDLDGDGDLDLVVANGDFTLSMLINRDGVFEVVGLRTMVWETTSVGIADLDDDGRLDLAVTDGYPERLAVIQNIGAAVEDQSCVADVDESGEVGFADLQILLQTWGPCEGCPTDLTGSGNVGFEDLLALLNAWGACPDANPGPGPVPGGFGG